MNDNLKKFITDLLIWAYKEGIKRGQYVITNDLDTLNQEDLERKFSEVLENITTKKEK